MILRNIGRNVGSSTAKGRKLGKSLFYTQVELANQYTVISEARNSNTGRRKSSWHTPE
jgi:hypothetical protein